MTKVKPIILIAVIAAIACFAEFLFQAVKRKMRPPPSAVLTYRHRYGPHGETDTGTGTGTGTAGTILTGTTNESMGTAASSASGYFDELPKPQHFLLSETDLSFFRENGYVVVRQG